MNTSHPSGKLVRWGLALQEANIIIHYHGKNRKNNATADSLSRYPVGRLSIHNTDMDNSIVAAIVGQENTDEGEENSSNLTLALSALEKSSCQIKVTHKRTEEFCVAAVASELQEQTQRGGN